MPANIITIRELNRKGDTFRVSASFDHGPEYEFDLQNPADEDQRKRFEWYFEEHLRFPFTDTEIDGRSGSGIPS